MITNNLWPYIDIKILSVIDVIYCWMCYRLNSTLNLEKITFTNAIKLSKNATVDTFTPFLFACKCLPLKTNSGHDNFQSFLKKVYMSVKSLLKIYNFISFPNACKLSKASRRSGDLVQHNKLLLNAANNTINSIVTVRSNTVCYSKDNKQYSKTYLNCYKFTNWKLESSQLIVPSKQKEVRNLKKRHERWFVGDSRLIWVSVRWKMHGPKDWRKWWTARRIEGNDRWILDWNWDLLAYLELFLLKAIQSRKMNWNVLWSHPNDSWDYSFHYYILYWCSNIFKKSSLICRIQTERGENFKHQHKKWFAGGQSVLGLMLEYFYKSRT